MQVTDDAKVPPSPVRKRDDDASVDARDYVRQQALSQVFEESTGLKQVAYRVFRLEALETWEMLFERAVTFTKQLPPQAIINVSHSGGKSGGFAVTVWYWEIIPVDAATVEEIGRAESTGNAPKP